MITAAPLKKYYPDEQCNETHNGRLALALSVFLAALSGLEVAVLNSIDTTIMGSSHCAYFDNDLSLHKVDISSSDFPRVSGSAR
jgi:hypothetical protein